MIYMVRAGADGPVKIGTAKDARRRMAGLQTSIPFALKLLRLIEGGRQTEQWLHAHFASSRCRGEWFDFSPAMMTVSPPAEPADTPAEAAIGRRAIEKAGGPRVLARKLGITPQAISQWARVPHDRVLTVSDESGIPAHELRPDLYRAPAAPASEAAA